MNLEKSVASRRYCPGQGQHSRSNEDNHHRFLCSALLLLTLDSTLAAPEPKAWTDPAAARSEDPDFSVQGEYGSAKPGAAFGVQVVALGDGKFDAYLLEGGLPGLGWTRGKQRTLLKGSRSDEKVTFSSEDKKVSATIHGAKLVLTRNGEEELTLPRIERSSPTLGAKPPQGAVVLFDGSSADHWEKGKVENGLLAATGCLSKKKFADCTLHLEFRTPYKPNARGQGRGNSGIYYGGRYETQILDSFGLEGQTERVRRHLLGRRTAAQHVPAAADLADLRRRLHRRQSSTPTASGPPGRGSPSDSTAS